MRLYLRLLRWASPSLAREYGDAMIDTFAARRADARRRGRGQLAYVCARELAALVVLAVSDRYGAAARERRRRQRALSHQKAGRMEMLGQEIRHAARRLLRSPAFTAATILTLALAIGANGAIFAVVERVVLNPLPYSESDRLITIDHGSVALRASGFGTTPGLYLHYRERSKTFESIAAYAPDGMTLTGGGEPERLRVTRATPSLSAVLKVVPEIGRWFTDGEGRPGAAPVVVISHGLWTRRYGANRGVIGEPVVLGGDPMEVVGVMPASFAFPDPGVDVWLPDVITREGGFGFWGRSGIARLRPGVSYEAARAEIQGLIPGVADAFPDDPRAKGNVETKLTFDGRVLKETIIGGITRALWIILAAMGVVLLVACANVANLFLVRSEVRQRDVAIRRALGAGGGGLARYFLTESLLLSLAGGALGLLIARAALGLLLQFGPATLPRLHEIHLNPIVVLYVAALSVLSAVAFGTMPLWRRGSSTDALHENGRANTATRRRHHVRHVLLGAQVAFALILLVASGLMVRSFQNLRAVDPGFDPSSKLTFRVGLPDREYPNADAAVRAHQAIVDRLSALPGVVGASGTTCLPLSMGCNGNTLKVEGVVYPPGVTPPIALFRAVTGGYLETGGLRLMRGRTITRDDVERKELVAVISESLAKRAFPDRDPIGVRVASNLPRAKIAKWLTIVGIVRDVPMRTVNEAPMPTIYLPLSVGRGADVPLEADLLPGTNMLMYVVHTSTPPLDLVPSVRQAVHAVDYNLAIAGVTSLQAMLDGASAQLAFTMVLLAIAAAVALMLGTVGIYGVMSYIVSQRTGEIGVRLALGAEPASIATQVLRQGGLVALGGIVVGLGVAFAGSAAIASVLYGVSPRDPGVFAGTAVALLVVALLACWLPARRASRLSPLVALRSE
jgi:predicted permease